MKTWKCENGYIYEIPDKACIICKHCTDIFWDHTHGPYMLICDKQTLDTDNLPCMIDGDGTHCPHWEEEEV